MKTYEKLSVNEQEELQEAMYAGKLEVYCPWWCEDHWEAKLYGELWDECYYRITDKPHSIT